MNECLKCGMAGARHTTHVCITAGAYEHAPATGKRFQFNKEPLAAVERRDNVTGLVAIRDWVKSRTREDRLRVWKALGGTEEDFPDA